MVSHEEVQAALSARIDGEEAELDDAIVDAHVSGCAECRAFLDRSLALSESLSQPLSGDTDDAMAPPQDLSSAILAGVDNEWRRFARRREIGMAVGRLMLGAMAVVWVLWAVRLILSGGEEPVVASSASVRFGVALALGFTAWRPQQIPGVLLIVGTMFTFTVGFAVRDFVLGTGAFELAGVLIPLMSLVALVWTWVADRGGALRRAWQLLDARPY
ncbi:zf-HC2 domain-containing protein [Corynebacterium haemomassiliense]|uniref:zf-HC2 domain-containing protein n=1 Tax=Corynebacterium haemomassiliense TaxID=2754726 RepID=UPI00288C17CB|nr:zf-HC2 domain-containing protein [Corynebacterium haemomassiliense]